MIPDEIADLMRRMLGVPEIPPHVSEFYFKARKMFDRIDGHPFNQQALCLICAMAGDAEPEKHAEVEYKGSPEIDWQSIPKDTVVELNWDGPKRARLVSAAKAWLRVAVDPSGDQISVRKSIAKPVTPEPAGV